jgi:hypothetical protein
MKIIITENKFKDTIRLSLKEYGTQTTIDNVGGLDNFCKVLNIESPMDFLHLFDDLEQVHSLEEENWVLFRYKKGENLMIYDRKSEDVYINYHEIWSFLEDKFGLNYDDIQSLTQKWLDEVNNLRGVTTSDFTSRSFQVLDEVNNLNQ